MKKITFSLLFLSFTSLLNAQTAILDSVEMGASYTNEMFFKLSDGSRLAAPVNNWHLGFSTSAQSVTIFTNAGLPDLPTGERGIQVALYPNGDQSDFDNNIDTTGFYSWAKLYNDSLDYDLGAFNQNATSGTDYGWGKYNTTTHKVIGDSIYIVKTATATYKIAFISKISGIYEFKYALIDNVTGGTTVTIDGATTYATKENVFFNLDNGQVIDRELAGYDLWALKYHDWYGDANPNQPVTGIITSPKWSVAVVQVGVGNQATNSDFSSATFANKLNGIGQHYKKLSPSFQWTITDSSVFYLKNAAGEVWKWYPTYFGGASNGKTIFYKQQVGFAGVNSLSTQFVDIYPNPTSDFATVVFEGNTSNTIISVRNQMGQIVTFETVNATESIAQFKLDLSNLQSGMYFVQVAQNGSSIIKTIVKK
ncbi:MAG: T9SS type A sorting domain-containing protein [Crocinitomicaceae bacterium]|nr:T9SS type A sorting domain-containing protein [Crocinitomicaceae bacterium]